MPVSFNKLDRIPLNAIDRQDSLTDFSLGLAPDALLLAGGAVCSRRAEPSGLDSDISRSKPLDALKASIREIGVIHPIALVKSQNRLRIVCGHRRATACASLGLTEIPALIAESGLDDETMLMLNLTENLAHRTFTDIEKGRVLNKLADADVPADIIIGKYMPLLSLERSKKLYQELSRAGRWDPALQKLIHELNVPLRNFLPLIQWDASSRDQAEKLFAVLRPGTNKWRELLELVDETATLENTSPAELFSRREIQALLTRNDLQAHEKYDQIVQAVTPWRYPALSALRKKVAQTLDQLPLGNRTKIRIQESFETEDIKIEIKGRDQKSLIAEVEKLAGATRSEAMGELMRILRELK